MASIRREIPIDNTPEEVWAAVRDVGAVHHRLVPGLVTDTVLDGDARLVTFANGKTVRELIVAIDDSERRVAYAPVGGTAIHHHSSMQVLPYGAGGSVLVWITDVLPHEVAAPIGALVEQGAAVIQKTLARRR